LAIFIFSGHEKYMEGYATCPLQQGLRIPHCSYFKIKTMEGLNMDRHEMYEIKKAIEAYQGRYSIYEKRGEDKRKSTKKWDFIIRSVCTGCGKTLHRYDNLNRYAFCYSCRRILFPETISSGRASRDRSRYHRPRGGFF
jgi:hypothetical protein